MFDVIWVALSYITNQATEIAPTKEEEVRGSQPADRTYGAETDSNTFLRSTSKRPVNIRTDGPALRRRDPLSTFVIPRPSRPSIPAIAGLVNTFP